MDFMRKSGCGVAGMEFSLMHEKNIILKYLYSLHTFLHNNQTGL